MPALVFDLYARGEQRVANAFRSIRMEADKTERATKSMSGAWSGLTKVGGLAGKAALGLGLGIAGAGAAVVAMTDDIIGLNLQVGKAKTVFGASFAAVDASLTKSASKFGITRIEALGLAGTIADMAKQNGFATRSAADMSLRFVDLAGRVKLLSAGQFDAAAASEALSAAFRGEFDSLQRVVPAISAERVELEAANIQKRSATKLTDEQAKMLAVLKIVQDGTKTSSSLMATEEGKKALAIEEARTSMREQWQEIQVHLLPAITALWEAVGQQLNPKMREFTAYLQSPEGKKAVQEWGAAIGGVIGQVGGLIGSLADLQSFTEQLALEARIAWMQIGLAVREADAAVADAIADIPGLGDGYDKAAEEAHRAVERIKRDIESMKTESARLEIDRLQRKIDSLKGKLVRGGLAPGERDRTIRELNDVQAKINRLEGRTVTISARTIYYGDGSARRINSDGTLGPIMKAAGGAVDGPGTETSDSIPARLSKGEHVWTAREVRAAGGHSAMTAMRRAALGGGGAYATGGEVTGTGPVMAAVDRTISRFTHRIVDRLVKRMDLLGAGSVQGWARQWAVIHQAFPGARLHSGYRPGAITSSGNVSYHARGRAIDVSPWMSIFDWIASRYGQNTKELIFSPAGSRQIHNGRRHYYSGQVRADHWDHVHWAMDNGGVATSPGVFAKLTRKPERVLSPAQTRSFDHMVRVLDRSGGSVVYSPTYSFPNYIGSHDDLVQAIKRADSRGDLDGLSIARRR